MDGVMHKRIAMLAAAIGLAGAAAAQESHRPAPPPQDPSNRPAASAFLPPPTARPRPPMPKGNPGLWVSKKDYPAEASAQKLSGTVGFRLDIGPDGKVEACTITASSGHDVLDRKTCELLMERAQFKPAQDQEGKPARGTFYSRMHWVYG